MYVSVCIYILYIVNNDLISLFRARARARWELTRESALDWARASLRSGVASLVLLLRFTTSWRLAGRSSYITVKNVQESFENTATSPSLPRRRWVSEFLTKRKWLSCKKHFEKIVRNCFWAEAPRHGPLTAQTHRCCLCLGSDFFDLRSL